MRKVKTLCLLLLIFTLTFSYIVSVPVAANETSNYFSNKGELVENPFIGLPIGSITPTGWLYDQLRLQADGITKSIKTDSGADILRNNWLNLGGDSWETGPYYIKGVVPMAFELNDQALKDEAYLWISTVVAGQRADGNFGPASAWDLWPRMPMMEAIRDYYDATQNSTVARDQELDAKIIPFFTKYFKYLESRQNELQSGLAFWGSIRSGDLLDTLYWTYNRVYDSSNPSDSKWLIDLGEKIFNAAVTREDNTPEDYYYGRIKNYGSRHIVNVAQSFKLGPMYYQQSKNPIHRDSFINGLENMNRYFGLADGMFAGTEWLRDISATNGTETCAVVEQMLSDELGLRITGNATLGDHLERVAFNSLPAGFDPDITKHQYYRMPNEIMDTYGGRGWDQGYNNCIVYGSPSGYKCCYHNLHQGWPKFVSNMWMATSDNGLAIAAYGPSEVTAKVADGKQVTVKEQTEYPFKNEVTFVVNTSENVNFPLKLRIPSWSTSTIIQVNGITQQGVNQGEYFTISKNWKDGDIVKVKFSDEVRVSNWENNSTAVERGPLVFSLKLDEKWVQNGKDFQVYPTSNWNYGLVYDKADLASSFKVIEKPATDGVFKFTEDNDIISIKATGKIIPQWIADGGDGNNSAGKLPSSPVISNEPSEEITLVPYGFAKIRVTNLPKVGNPSNEIVYEAEDTKLAKIEKDSSASAGKAAVVSENFKFTNVTATLGELYDINIVHKGDAATYQVKVNNELQPGNISLESSPQYKTTVVNGVKLGTHIYNTIEFIKVSGGISTFDCIKLSTSGDYKFQNATIYEAENASTNGTISDLSTNPLNTPSGKKYVQLSGAGKYVEWNVNVPTAGTYPVKVYLSSGGTDDKAIRTITLTVNGVSSALDYWRTQYGWGRFEDTGEMTLNLNLNAGNNKIKISKESNNSSNRFDVDCIKVVDGGLNIKVVPSNQGTMAKVTYNTDPSATSYVLEYKKVSDGSVKKVELPSDLGKRPLIAVSREYIATDLTPGEYEFKLTASIIDKKYESNVVTINTATAQQGEDLPKPVSFTDGSGSENPVDRISPTQQNLFNFTPYGNLDKIHFVNTTEGAYKVSFDSNDNVKIVDGNTAWQDYVYEGTISLSAESPSNDAGFMVRVTNPSSGSDAYTGYYVGIANDNRLKVGSANNGWTHIADVPVKMNSGNDHDLKVIVYKDNIVAYVDGNYAFAFKDSSYVAGQVGVRAYNKAFSASAMRVRPLTAEEKTICESVPKTYMIGGTEFNSASDWTKFGSTGNITVNSNGSIDFNANTNVRTVATKVPGSNGGSWSDAGNNKSWQNYVYEVDITLKAGSGDQNQNAGAIFRVMTCGSSNGDNYQGLYAGISIQNGGRLIVGRGNNGWTEIANVAAPVAITNGVPYTIKVVVFENTHVIYVNNIKTYTLTDSNFGYGRVGVRSYNRPFNAANAKVRALTPEEYAMCHDLQYGVDTPLDISKKSMWTTYGTTSKITINATDENVDSIYMSNDTNVKAVAGSVAWKDYVYEADIKIGTLGDSGQNAGLLFRLMSAGSGANGFNGYYAGINSGNTLIVGAANGNWQEMASIPMDLPEKDTHRIKAVVKGNDCAIYVDGIHGYSFTIPVSAGGTTFNYPNGFVGIRSYNREYTASNFSIRAVTEQDFNEMNRVSDLAVQPLNNSALVTFNTNAKASYYKILYGTVSGTYTGEYLTNGGVATVPGLTNGQTYYFTVVPYTEKHQKLVPSSEVSVIPAGSATVDKFIFKSEKQIFEAGANVPTTLTATLSNGSNATLTDIAYTSDNPAVATVSSSGVITGVGAGSTYIWVSAKCGNDSIRDVVRVSVVEKGILPHEYYALIGLTDEEGNNLYSISKDKVNITGKIQSGILSNNSYVIVGAVYDKDNVLCKMVDLTSYTNVDGMLTFNGQIDTTGKLSSSGYYLKLFVWSSMQDVKPVTAVLDVV